MKKKIVTTMGVFALILSLAFTGCSGNSDAEPKKEEKEYLSESDIANLFSDPDNYKGKYVKLSGKIFNGPDTAENYVAYQAWHDIQNSTNDFVFGMENPEEDFNVDDYVIVDGKITGTFEGENAFGTTIECPQIDAISIEKQSYMEAVVPTIKELTPENAISEQNGWYMSFENPEYTLGIIKINNMDADNILNEHDLNIPLNYLYDFAKAFCIGANIKMKSVG